MLGNTTALWHNVRGFHLLVLILIWPACISHWVAPTSTEGLVTAQAFKTFLEKCQLEDVGYSGVIDLEKIIVDGNPMTGYFPYDRFLKDNVVFGKLHTKQCKGSDRWTAYTFGPMNTTGGSEWYSIPPQQAPQLSDTIEQYRPGLYALSSFAFVPVASDYSFIGYPPLTMHHLHLYGSGDWWSKTVITHDENQCTVAGGGTDCFIRTAPHGMAYVLSGSLKLFCGYFDARQAHSQPLIWSLLLAVQTVARKMPIAAIRSVKIQVNPQPWESRATYVVDSWTECVIWNVYALNDFLGSNFQIINSYFHHHGTKYVDVMVFAENLANVFHNLSIPMNAMAHGDNVIEHTAARLPQGLCSTYDQPVEFMVFQGVRQAFERLHTCCINDDVQMLTLVAFHKQVLDAPRRFLRHHAMLRLLISAPLDAPATAWASDYTVERQCSRLNPEPTFCINARMKVRSFSA